MVLCSDLWIHQRDFLPHKLHIDVCDNVHSAWGDRGLTEVTPYDILETLVHRQASETLLLGMLEQ